MYTKFQSSFSTRMSKLKALALLAFFLLCINHLSAQTNTFVDGRLEADFFDTKTNFSELSEYESDYFIFSHGKPGYLLIENSWMSKEEILDWLRSNPDTKGKSIRIYGCEFGKGTIGKNAVNYLSNALQVPVSASNDITGKDGDWDLEVGAAFHEFSWDSYLGNLQTTCSGRIGFTAGTDDYDGDGYCNSDDLDDDNDGIPDLDEGGIASCTPIDVIKQEATCLQRNNNRYKFTEAEMNLISDGSRSTEASNATENFISKMSFTFTPTRVSNIYIFNYLNGKLGNKTTPHIDYIQVVNLYNAKNQLVFTDSNISSSGTLMDVSVPGVEGVTRLELIGVVDTYGVGIGLRDVYLSGCPELDADGDGIINKFDADSDGDGCPDAVESDAVSSTVGYKFTELDTRWMVVGAVGTSLTAGDLGVPNSNPNLPVGAYDSTVQADECNNCMLGSSYFVDEDMDGVGNECDQDNDNDGILDADECPNLEFYRNQAITTIDFSNAYEITDPDPTDFFGPKLFTPNAAVLPDGTCVDVLIEVEQLTTDLSPYMTWHIFPDSAVEFYGNHLRVFDFTVSYFQCGTTTPVEISTIYTIRDIDGDCDWDGDGISDNDLCDSYKGGFGKVDDWVSVPTSEILTYSFEDTTALYDRVLGDNTHFFSSSVNNNNASGISAFDGNVDENTQKVNVTYRKLSKFHFQYNSGTFGGIIPDFSGIDVPLCDFDGDGIPNFLDLDSDDDGCPDAIEGGDEISSADLDSNTAIDGSVDTDGVPVSVGSTGQTIGTEFERTISPCVVPDTIAIDLGGAYDTVLTACPSADEISTLNGTYHYCDDWNTNIYTITGPDSGCYTATPVNGDTTMFGYSPITACVYACDSAGLCDTTIYILQYAVPTGIDYRDFKVENYSDCKNRISWTSTFEENTEKAVIQRRYGLNGEFSTIGSLKLAGESSIDRQYIFEDSRVYYKGDVYYRIVFVDNDGSAAISEAERVSNTCGEEGVVIKSFPNPNDGHFTVNIQGLDIDKPYMLRITDAVGRVVKTISIDPTKASYDIDLGNLSSNIYLIEVTNSFGQAIDYNLIFIK